MSLTNIAIRRPLFMLGICRSHQLWNVAAGGSLIQDLVAEGHCGLGRNQRAFGIDPDRPFVLRGRHGKLLFEKDIVFAGRRAGNGSRFLSHYFFARLHTAHLIRYPLSCKELFCIKYPIFPYFFS